MDIKEIILAAAAGIWGFFTVYFIYAKKKSDDELRDYKTSNSKNIENVNDRVSLVSKEVNTITKTQV